jgi:transposase
MKYLFLRRNSAKKIYDDMSFTLSDKRPSYSTVKNWVARLRTGHLSTENEECPGRPTQVTIPENADAIHFTLLDDRRISAKK